MVWGDSFYPYRAARVADFPATGDWAIQESQRQTNPASIYQGFGLHFQNVGNIQNENTGPLDAAGTQSYRGSSSQQVAVNLPVPNTSSSDVWFVELSMEVTESSDRLDIGSLKLQLLRFGINIADILIPRRYTRWHDSLQYTSDVLGTHYSENEVSSQKFKIVLQAQNARTKSILTLRDETPNFVRIYSRNASFFYNTGTGQVQRWSMDNPISAALARLAEQFQSRHLQFAGISESTVELARLRSESQAIAKEADESEEKLKLLEELRASCEQLRKVNAELGKPLPETCRSILQQQ